MFVCSIKIKILPRFISVMRQKKSALEENIRKTKEEKQKMEIPKVKIYILMGKGITFKVPLFDFSVHGILVDLI